MANNKVQLADGTVLVDLTDTTATASDVASGKYFYNASGVKTAGTASGGGTGAISVVDTTDSHGGTVRTITALDISDTTAVASDVAQGKYFYTAQGVKTAGTGSGGTPSATQHTIYFEFSDSTDATITAYWDDSFISDAITATTPTTYGQKTVDSASLDGAAWYTRPTETWETLWDGNLSWEQEGSGDYPYCWIPSLGSTPITVGSVYRVTYDNTEYRCTAKDAILSNGETFTVFGNPVWSGGADDGSGVPFAFIDYTRYGAWSGGLNAPNVSSVYYFKIEHLATS